MTEIHLLKNLPRRTREGTLSNRVEGKVYKDFIQLSVGGWLVCDDIPIDIPPGNLADTIARVIELALDAGFEQGREYIRMALGVPEPKGRLI